MKINQKGNNIKITIKEIKNILENVDNNNSSKAKIEELNNEILRLKKGIGASVSELEEFLGEEDAGS